MLQAPVLDSLSFDPFPFQQDGLAAPEVDIGGREVIQACTTMRTEDVTDTLELALKASGYDQAKVVSRR